MSRFAKDNVTATIYRQSYSDADWYNKSSYSATGDTAQGNLKALTLADGVEISNFGKEYQFNTTLWADIKESDRLRIDWEDYDVKGVSKYKGVTFSRLMCMVQRW